MCLQILKNRRQEKSAQAQRFLKTQIEKSPPRFFFNLSNMQQNKQIH